jgi:hypothetical protein
MSSRILDWMSPCEMLNGDDERIFLLKVFGCVCFMRGNRPTVGELNPRAIKCVFLDYSATQKGYVYWSPVERKLFVSMDVTLGDVGSYFEIKIG